MVSRHDPETLAKIAVGLYCTNNAMNHIHHSSDVTWNYFLIKRLFHRMIVNATEGMPSLQRLFRN